MYILFHESFYRDCLRPYFFDTLTEICNYFKLEENEVYSQFQIYNDLFSIRYDYDESLYDSLEKISLEWLDIYIHLCIIIKINNERYYLFSNNVDDLCDFYCEHLEVVPKIDFINFFYCPNFFKILSKKNISKFLSFYKKVFKLNTNQLISQICLGRYPDQYYYKENSKKLKLLHYYLIYQKFSSILFTGKDKNLDNFPLEPNILTHHK